LRLKRLEVTRTALTDRLAAGDLQHTRALVESLAHDFDIMDIAASAIALLHERDEPSAAAVPEPETERRTTAAGPMETIFIGAGSDAQIRPGDLVGAITNEARVAASDIGAIRVSRNHSLVQVQAERVESIIRALRNTTIK